MTNGLTYACVVRATSAAGTGPHSAPASVRVGAPSAPGWVSAKKTSAGTLSVALGVATSFTARAGHRLLRHVHGEWRRLEELPGECTHALDNGPRHHRRAGHTCAPGVPPTSTAPGPLRNQSTCSSSRAAVNLDKPSGGVVLQSGPHDLGVRDRLPPRRPRLGGSATRPLLRWGRSPPTRAAWSTVRSRFPSTVEDGSHTLIATGASATGTFTETAPVTVMEDITPPTLTAFAISPTTIDTSTAAANDHRHRDTSPTTAPATPTATSSFHSPSGQNVYAYLDPAHRISGTPQNGDYSYTMTIPQDAEQGTWTVQDLYLTTRSATPETSTPPIRRPRLPHAPFTRSAPATSPRRR